MSTFRVLAARCAPFVAIPSQRVATFHSSRALASGKESHLHHEGRADEVAEKKDNLLKKQKEGKGEWEEGLASDSESIVKADRGEVEASEETIKKLQKESEKLAGKQSRT